MSQNKKNYTYIWVSFILLVFGIYVIPKIIERFKNNTIVQNDRLNVAPIDQQAEELKVIASAPTFELTNENGEKMSSDFYKGKVHVIEFFFTSCPSICPIMNQNMRVLDDLYHENPNFGIASISIDEQDTPDILKKHAEELGVKSPNWHFFWGTQDEVFSIAKKFNLYAGANPEAPGGFEHSGMFALVDKNGKIRSRLNEFEYPIVYYDGTTEEGLDMLKEDIKILIAE